MDGYDEERMFIGTKARDGVGRPGWRSRRGFGFGFLVLANSSYTTLSRRSLSHGHSNARFFSLSAALTSTAALSKSYSASVRR
jgi:hypothetical protein